MNFKTAINYTRAIASAIAILTLAPTSIREREVAAAKARLMARRQAGELQAQQRQREIERELQALQAMKQAISSQLPEQPIAPQPEPLPQLPDPWMTATAIELPTTPATATPQQHRWQPALPPAKSSEPAKSVKLAKPSAPKAKKSPTATKPAKPAPDLTKLNIRELKKLASGKIKGYSSLTKAQLIKALQTAV